jgi:hypothetical protein
MRLGTAETLRLKPGVDPRQGAARLAELVELGGNVTSRAGSPEGVPVIRDDYLNWIEQVENCLADLTSDHEPGAGR